MKTLVFYDETGYLLDVRSGEPAPREPVGVPFLWTDVPANKYVESVDVSVTPHKVVLKDRPPTEAERVQQNLDIAILELTTLMAMGGSM